MVSRCLFRGIEVAHVSFLVSRYFLGIEILHSVVQLLDHLLPWIIPCMLFWVSTSCKLEVKEDLYTEKKIKKSRFLKQRHLDTYEKSHPIRGETKA